MVCLQKIRWSRAALTKGIYQRKPALRPLQARLLAQSHSG